MAQPAHMLLIDDEPNLLHSLALILTGVGNKVDVADNGEAAIQLLQNTVFDLIFLDIKLPDMNGMDLLGRIREIDRNTPVIVLTAHASLETAIDAVRKGARDYLLKPIEPAELLERIDEILAEQQQPKRRKEIANQIQSLLDEMTQIENEKAGPNFPEPVPSTSDPDRFFICGQLTMDLHTRHALLCHQYVPLPPTTFDYLVTLARHSPEVVTFENLVRESQGFETSRSEARDIVRWQVHELRAALEIDPGCPQLIITVRNVGYRLVA
ncbi:MAG TPA: response regulator transcription factor [Anaerolineaceae bacterium]|nr:response regulator transcription factor [Anaerolineaceae bacterium]